jgi:amino acid adenylation domain-containing protein
MSHPFVQFGTEEIEQSIPDRFEQQVAKYPERIAVKTRNHVLTYDELNKTANRMARAILAQREKEDEPIALLLEHGADAIAAILGVLKAGKIYVPLDLSYPRARIAGMLEDCAATLIVTSGKNLSLAHELSQSVRQLVNIEELDPKLSTDNLSLSLSPDTLAYILYTSGSTGQPKGVVQNHRNLLNHIKGETNSLHICVDDRLTLLRSSSVIGGTRAIFSALLNGATICPLNIAEEGLSKLTKWLLQEEITIYDSVPTVFRNFVGSLTGDERFSKLRIIRLGSEQVYKRDVELYKSHFSPDCIFVNSLGITEAGSVRHYFIDKETSITGSIVPVGYALDDKEVLLLGDDGKKVGFNQMGEIAVRSRYLSLGYWRRPDLTRAKFLSDPNGGDERVYLTGDLGRMLPDGCLEHLGRQDLQVKVRGNTIEVAEVEEALLELSAIKEAVVVVLQDKSGNQRLVAYLAHDNCAAASVSELRSFLKNKLPTYMVPSVFVFLDALPLAPSGKVNRSALPEPEWNRPQPIAPFVAPRTPVEKMVADIWTDVIGLERAGVKDNFFDLGGHSLLATRILSAVRDLFHVEVELGALFDHPTIEELALMITETLARNAAQLEPMLGFERQGRG